MACAAQLRDRKYAFPPAKVYSGNNNDTNANDPGGQGLVLNTTAFTMMLSYLEQSAMYQAYNFSLPSCPSTDTPTATLNINFVGGATSYLANTTVTSSVIATFLCPSDGPALPYNSSSGPYATQNAQRCNYLLAASQYYEYYNGVYFKTYGVPKDAGIFSGCDMSTTIAQVKDGTSNTLLVGESPIQKYQISYGGYWGQGAWTSTHGLTWPPTSTAATRTLPNYPYTGSNPPAVYAWQFGSAHPGGMNALFADGSVKYIKNSINIVTMYGLGTRSFGEVISADAYRRPSSRSGKRKPPHETRMARDARGDGDRRWLW